MKVLMMVSWYSPEDTAVGIGIFHYEQAMALKKYCDVAIYYPYDRDISAMTDAVENGIKVYRSKYKLERKIRNRYNMFRAMKKIKREFNPDVIHAHVATEAGRFAVVLGRLFHIPVVITEHSTIEASGVREFPHHMYAKFAYKHSKYNACVSDNLRDGLGEIFPQYCFHTVYNGIKIPPAVEATKIYKIDGAVNMILVASLYDRDIKGIPNLLTVVRGLKEQGYKIRLHIVGDGEYQKEFENLAVSLGIKDECIFHGRLAKDEVYAILKQMDFLVSASKFESFGCSVAEAMMVGKPVVATRSGGTESIVTKETGMLIEKENVKALYEGIEDMISNYGKYDSVAIKNYARSRFDIDLISKKYLNIYNVITGQ